MPSTIFLVLFHVLFLCKCDFRFSENVLNTQIIWAEGEIFIKRCKLRGAQQRLLAVAAAVVLLLPHLLRP